MPWATDSYNLGDAEDWCRRSAARFLVREDAGYLLFRRDDSRHIGNISVWSKDWQVLRFEIGYWLATSAVGHGYMTEALRAVTEMAFKDFGARRIELRTDARNRRSRAVAERAGYLLESIPKNDGRDNRGELNDECLYALTQ
jgi:RimJ/RimL family protein N-acetyltransferase